jgi:primosomal protein N' (replication factor Y) (superfamily II helicase)
MKQTGLFPEPPPEWVFADEADLQVARVVLNIPVDTAFDYLVPDLFRGKVQPGMRVRVPFGRGDQVLTGYCVWVGRPEVAPGQTLKLLSSLVDERPLLSARMLELTRWIADRYLCAWGQVLDSVIPAGVRKQAGTREMQLVTLTATAEAIVAARLTSKQQSLLDLLGESTEPWRRDRLLERAGCGAGPLSRLRELGLVRIHKERLLVDEELEATASTSTSDLQLNADQRLVLTEIEGALREKRHETFVLFGVTGSGKTEVYIQAIREVVSYGRQAIVLVPEISLTPQTIRRFRSRFRSVAVLHSHLTDVERHREWTSIATGEVEVIVGARSAVFAPTPHLGLIVIDEEHETSFKQDKTPRYHAREVARKRAEMEGIPLILGSATPTLESWRRTQTGPDKLLSMPRRVEGLPMPPVIIVDVRSDPYTVRGQAIGRSLGMAMKNALEDKGQVILFQNLRGYSPVLWCPQCGEPARCPNCDVSLNWHADIKQVLCHVCDYHAPPPRTCRDCPESNLRYLGVGTQRLEQEVKLKFPDSRCVRMDSDSMRARGSHDEALEAFRRGEVEILLGTQMISKGLDFPNVTLVGVVQADTVLHQPDLRATERTFQLIAQVAGRTGRSQRGGRVLVQTSSPTEPAILLAAQHAYPEFAKMELETRREVGAPPYSSLVRVVLRGPDEQGVDEEAKRLGAALVAAAKGLVPPVLFQGPCPAQVRRLEAHFRFHLQMSSPDLEALLTLWRKVGAGWKLKGEVEMAVDVDPINLR